MAMADFTNPDRKTQAAAWILLGCVSIFVVAVFAFLGASFALLFAMWLGPYNDELRAVTAGGIAGGLVGAVAWALALKPAWRRP